MNPDQVRSLILAELAAIPPLPLDGQAELRELYAHRRGRHPHRPPGRVLEEALAAVAGAINPPPLLFFDPAAFPLPSRAVRPRGGR